MSDLLEDVDLKVFYRNLEKSIKEAGYRLNDINKAAGLKTGILGRAIRENRAIGLKHWIKLDLVLRELVDLEKIMLNSIPPDDIALSQRQSKVCEDSTSYIAVKPKTVLIDMAENILPESHIKLQSVNDVLAKAGRSEVRFFRSRHSIPSIGIEPGDFILCEKLASTNAISTPGIYVIQKSGITEAGLIVEMPNRKVQYLMVNGNGANIIHPMSDDQVWRFCGGILSMNKEK